MVLHRFGAEPCPEAPNPLVWPDREARGRMSERQYRGTVINLSAGDVTAAVDRAHGGRLASLVVGGMELLVQRPSTAPIDPLSWGCFPMVPFAGRLRGGRFSSIGNASSREGVCRYV